MILLLFALTIPGCGKKGPLYLPDATRAVDIMAASSADPGLR